MNGAGLANALRLGGCPCEVEARERMAIVRVAREHAGLFAADGFRADALRMGREHGFTHVALEIVA